MVLLLTDPEEVKCELLCLYARFHLHLTLMVPVARGIVRDLYDNNFVLLEELWNHLIHFTDQLLDIVYLIRKAQLYKRLPEDTLEYDTIQYKWCALDLLHHQLSTLHTLVCEHIHHSAIPNQLVEALADDLAHKAQQQVEEWGTQLKFDLECIYQLADDVSGAQRSPIGTEGSDIDKEPVAKRTHSMMVIGLLGGRHPANQHPANQLV